MRILLKNGRVIDPASGKDEVTDILIEDGVILKLRENLEASGDVTKYDLKGKVIVPGFLDMHVHLREPGFEYKETIESGCMSAAAGGFTAVACMPNTQPAIDDASIIRSIQEKARSVLNGLVDVYPVAAVTMGREGKVLSPMLELAEAGAVAFTDDGAPVANAEVMRRALEYAGMIGRTIIQHAEELSMTKGGAMNEGFNSTSLGMPGMPSVAEEIVVARDIHLAQYTGSSYHVAHVSTSGSVELVRMAKRKGVKVSCEVTPHHFSLTDESVRSFDTNTKMNPPLRGRGDVEAMKEGLRDGTIDVIATDHAPHSFDDKEVEFIAAPFGIVGLETAIGLSIAELVGPGIISLAQLVEKFSVNPRKILKLPPISIAEGEKANLTMLDPAVQWTVDVRQFKSKAKNSPFNGRVLTGRAIGIINNGTSYFT